MTTRTSHCRICGAPATWTADKYLDWWGTWKHILSPLDELTTWLEKHPDDGYLLDIHYYHYDKPGVWRVNLEQHDDLLIGTEADTIQEAADRLLTQLKKVTP